LLMPIYKMITQRGHWNIMQIVQVMNKSGILAIMRNP